MSSEVPYQTGLSVGPHGQISLDIIVVQSYEAQSWPGNITSRAPQNHSKSKPGQGKIFVAIFVSISNDNITGEGQKHGFGGPRILRLPLTMAERLQHSKHYCKKESVL